MTLQRPMFPPQAALKTCADTAPVSTCSEVATDDHADDQVPAASEATPEALYRRVNISPEDLFKALGRLRSEAAAEIERLIAFLDETDGDADLEPDGVDEPILGAPENHREQGIWAAGNDDGREGDAGFDDREGDELEHGGDGAADDYELSGDENEPVLGSFDRLWSQEHAWRQTSGIIGRCWDIHSNCDAERDASI